VQGRLGGLAQGPVIWQVGCRRLPAWVDSPSGPFRPWITLVVNSDPSLVLGQGLTEERPSPDYVFDRLAEAMQHPLAGPPGRPAEVQFQTGSGMEALRLPLGGLGVRWAERDTLAGFDDAAGSLARHMAQGEPPGLLDVPGLTPEQVGRFYEAAAAFYDQAPWLRLEFEAAIKVACDRLPGGPWYAVIMGRSGMTMGLTLYDDLALLERLWAGNLSDAQNARLTVATTVLFGEPYEISAADLEAAERYGWRVAGPDAYPNAFRKERGRVMRPPSPRELGLLEVGLRALPGFVQRHPQDDPAEEEVTVPLGPEEATLRLSWVQA
jgi:hypothetical protein